MFLMRGDVPLREMVRYERDWVRKLGLAVLGRILIRGYPWSEAFFLASARRFKQAVDLPIMLLGGLTELETMNRAIGEGFAFVALGRALIANPDLVGRMQSGELSRSICNHCNQCVAEMEREEGVRCVLEGSAAGLEAG
jgi:2,4-dienoyl-CoA reductase-like NADH-dependent reductase (Old Yellow Enzyme family)